MFELEEIEIFGVAVFEVEEIHLEGKKLMSLLSSESPGVAVAGPEMVGSAVAIVALEKMVDVAGTVAAAVSVDKFEEDR